MNFSCLNGWQKLVQFSTSLSFIVGTTLLSSLVIKPAGAFTITFSFSSDNELTNDGINPNGVINDWNHGGSTGITDGWTAGENTGTAIDGVTGLQITFTGAPQNSNSTNANLFGDAITNSQNFNFDDRGSVTTKGLKIEDTNLSDDGNVTTLIANGSERTLSGGTLVNYQLLTFSFSQPIVIDSSTRFFIDDIDDDSSTGTSETYIDSVAIEAFSSPTIGNPGTGIDPNFTFESSTNLETGTIDFANSNDINYVYDSTDNNVNNANIAENKAYYDFGSTEEVQSVALYFFNGLPESNASNNTSGHAVVFGGSFDVQPASGTAVPFEFAPGWGLLLSGAGLLGFKHFKHGKHQSINIFHRCFKNFSSSENT